MDKEAIALTKKKLKEFYDALIAAQVQDAEPYLKLLEVNALKGKIEDLENELAEYESIEFAWLEKAKERIPQETKAKVKKMLDDLEQQQGES
jgi:transcriptional/translational regulatory protein YebC/TACO1